MLQLRKLLLRERRVNYSHGARTHTTLVCKYNQLDMLNEYVINHTFMDCCLTPITLGLSGCSIATFNCTDQHKAESIRKCSSNSFHPQITFKPTLAEFDLKQNNKPPTTFSHPKPYRRSSQLKFSLYKPRITRFRAIKTSQTHCQVVIYKQAS